MSQSKNSFVLGQHFLAGIDGKDISPAAKRLIEDDHVLGFTLFKRNFDSSDELLLLTTELAARARHAGYEIVLAVDQEGGRVFRLPQPFTQIPPMRFFGEYVSRTGRVDAVFTIGQILGREVAAAGFNLDFAPVADVDLNAHNPIIGDRSFSADPEIVSRCVRALVCGLGSVGVSGCLKHFPGHGATIKDSHLELPEDARVLSEIIVCDLKPYLDAITLGLCPIIMTAHVVYPKVDGHRPATLSHYFLQNLLRHSLNYEGVIFSDDLLMKAIADHAGVPGAAIDFFQAGGDVALICKNPELARETIQELQAQVQSCPELAACLKQSQVRLRSFKKSLSPAASHHESLKETCTQNQFRLSSLLKTLQG